MLKKVLKYDLKYVYKVLVIFYILVLLFALLTRIFWSFDNSVVMNILGYIASGCTISFMLNILINNMMRLWARFVKNIYGDESYLTHTLPVSKGVIYSSKFLSSVITIFTSILVILIGIFIAYYSKENLEILKNALDIVASAYESSVFVLLFEMFMVCFLEIVFIIEIGYTGIILGHKSNNNKVLKSIIYGFSIYVLVSMLLLLFVFIIGIFNTDIMNLFMTNDMINVDIIKILMVGVMLVYTLLLIIFYVIDIKCFKKGVDVQ